MKAFFIIPVIVLLFSIFIPLVGIKYKSILTFAALIINNAISIYFAYIVLINGTIELSTNIGFPFYIISFKIDSLSAIFILIINFIVLNGAWYGFHYLRKYKERTTSISIHCISFLVLHLSMMLVCVSQNMLVFLFFWEMMTLAAFMLVIFESEKNSTLKAGINYLIQAHISVIFLIIGIAAVVIKTGSYNFDAISVFTQQSNAIQSILLFVIFFAGFAIKAGFVPFHSWLPYAHPSAPSHVSGIMSGVIIKLGIYGILRILLLIKTNYLVIGEIILFFSILSGLYGVMYAIIQHDLKRLLAYHSIENIGIIGIGIGIGYIGIGINNPAVTFLGFTGGILHVFNHSLFKSLLFFSAGTIYQKMHTLNIEMLGGLIKKLPQTAFLFLIAAIAICGLPPLNGFISEFIIYLGLFKGIFQQGFSLTIYLLFSIISLVLIGGLAILCFTKAFSIVFLGSTRENHNSEPTEANFWMLFPQYIILLGIFAVAFIPSFFIGIINKTVLLYLPNANLVSFEYLNTFSKIGFSFFIFFVILFVIYIIKKYIQSSKQIEKNSTWGCGYIAANSKMQYTSTSYSKSYANVAKPVLNIRKIEEDIDMIFPEEKSYKTNVYDKIEFVLIDKPIYFIKKFFEIFTFLQNGQVQVYGIYGVVFIFSILVISFISNIINMLNQLINII